MTGESDWKMVHVGEAQINIPAPNPGFRRLEAPIPACSTAEPTGQCRIQALSPQASAAQNPDGQPQNQTATGI